MKQEDRDMLIRINERTLNIWRTVEKQEKHQETQNGHIQELFTRTNSNSNRISLIWKVAGWVGGSVFGGGVITIIVCRVLGVF